MTLVQRVLLHTGEKKKKKDRSTAQETVEFIKKETDKNHSLERTRLVKITAREFLDNTLHTNSVHIIVRWTSTYNFLMHQASAFKLKFYRLWCKKCNLLYSWGPLPRTRFIAMAKHESGSTYICMDNSRIFEKTFFVPLGFEGYLLAIEYVVHETSEYIKIETDQ